MISIMMMVVLFIAFIVSGVQSGVSAERPNVVLIYADDLGYGDVGCYGAKTIPTPNIDRLASEGLRFTSGYSTSATCTPSRYSLLTGEYAWRRKGTGILPPNGTTLIEPGRPTLASMLKQAGYQTAMIGKWHLGLGRPPKPAWSGRIEPGPLDVGFDHAFIVPTTGDRVPCVYIEDRRIVNLDPADPVDVFDTNPDGQPTGETERASLKMDWIRGHNQSVVNGISRIGFMTGGMAARWKDEEMADLLTAKARAFITENREQPFFLMFATHDIHVPRVPHPRFRGKTPHGPRGDAVVEFDWCVGEIVAVLEELRLAKNTLVIISSDNGPVVNDGYRDEAVEKLGEHRPAGPWRGGKYTIFEGGTRVPWIVSWPGRVRAGESDAMISQVDLPRSLTALSGQVDKIPSGAFPDSEDLLPTLLGEVRTGRDEVVEHAATYALRRGMWKYIAPALGRKATPDTKSKSVVGNEPQLYNLKSDPGETKNLAVNEPERVKEMAARLEKIQSPLP